MGLRVVKCSGVSGQPGTQAPPAFGRLLWMTGDDGDVTISSNASLLYHYKYRNLTIETGKTLTVGLNSISVADTLTIHGAISGDGLNGKNAAGNSGGDGAFNIGQYSGAEFASASNGAQGNSQDSSWGNGFRSLSVCGGFGGNGGSAGSKAGGEYDTSMYPCLRYRFSPFRVWDFGRLRNEDADIMGDMVERAIAGGGGCGGASWNDYGGRGGGGGGAGGRFVVIFAKNIIMGDGALISARGGDGGNGAAGEGGEYAMNPGAGGGGGGGGVVFLCYETLEGYSPSKISVSGGKAGKAGAANGASPASDGGVGEDGVIYRFNLSTGEFE